MKMPQLLFRQLFQTSNFDSQSCSFWSLPWARISWKMYRIFNMALQKAIIWLNRDLGLTHCPLSKFDPSSIWKGVGGGGRRIQKSDLLRPLQQQVRNINITKNHVNFTCGLVLDMLFNIIITSCWIFWCSVISNRVFAPSMMSRLSDILIWAPGKIGPS